MMPFAETSSDLNYLKRILYKKLHLSWGIPFWQDKTTLTSQAASGQKILSVGSTQYRNFEIGALCIIMASRTSYEIGTIDILATNQITILANLASTWPAGTSVYPVMKAKIQPEQVINLRNPKRGQINLIALEDYDGGITRHIPDISSFPTLESIPVFNFRPEHESIEEGLFHPYESLIFLGKSLSASDWIETGHRLKGDFLARGRDTIWKYLDFFDEHKGRWGNFWIPTFQADIVVNTAFGAGDTILTIDPIEYPTYWASGETARFIALLWPDDTLILREIINADATTITLDGTVGKTCTDPGTLLVSFLLMSRFDIDEIEVKYLLDDEADVDKLASLGLSFYSLPAETPA
jgi:hypothetical protein